jgi:membrane-associated phospholipid phosphatase
VDFKPHLSQLRRAHWFFRIGYPLLALVYLGTLGVLGGLESLHFILVGIGLVLCLWNDFTRKLAKIGLPFLLYGAVYDSMRWYEDYIRSPVIHVHEPYDFDLRLFGVHGLTPNEYLQKHTSKALDFLCGLAYTPMFFIGESIVLGIYFVAKNEMRRGQRFVWTFVVANFIGFSCYYIYPAAPPWYVADHGFGVDLTVRASAAGALRFDHLIGYPLMENFYGHSADVFGAIPSLHVVYPFLAMWFGWKLPRFRPVAIAYWLLVCFSAIYLNHHYVLDLFVGLGIAALVLALGRAIFGPVDETADEPSPVAPLRTYPRESRSGSQ